ncbi:MAG: CRISPR-associated endonuclease Cas2 [Hyphomicrobiaceae bacterium]
MTEPLYIVAYDIADPRRWRRVYRLLQGYGEWVQLSLFQCRLDPMRRRLLEAELAQLIEPRLDRVLIARIAEAEKTGQIPRPITSLGPRFVPLRRVTLVL